MRRLWTLAALPMAFCGALQAQTAPPPEAFFERPQMSAAEISPDGRHLAVRLGSKEFRERLAVVDLKTMKVTGTVPVGDTPDVLAFDPGWRRLYVASESGTVSVFTEAGAGLVHEGDIRIPHAHTVAVDPRTHLVYLPLQDIGGRPVLRIMTGEPPAGP